MRAEENIACEGRNSASGTPIILEMHSRNPHIFWYYIVYIYITVGWQKPDFKVKDNFRTIH